MRKAFLHNSYVSRAITENNGFVVKWIGDGVMGCFTDQRCGQRHGLEALRAAISGVSALRQNCKCADNPDEEIRTKVALSSGNFHFLSVDNILDPQPDGDLPSILDPMGSEVDLAARMNSIASSDSILIDKETFWGISATSAEVEQEIGVGICTAEYESIKWRTLILTETRETVYKPAAAGFFLGPDGLELSRVSRTSSSPIEPERLAELVDHDAGVNGNKRNYVFVSKPVHCNIRGYSETVEVVAISLDPSIKPIVETTYTWRTEEIDKIESKAEKSFRQGRIGEAFALYTEVLDLDPRHFHANVRIAMIHRHKGDTERAMAHLTAAKQSNPTCPLVWGVAGVTHLDDFLHDRGDKTACLNRAVNALQRARTLAHDQFHGLLEQYTTIILAIAHLLRDNVTENDKSMAEALIQDLDLWPPKNEVVKIAKRLAQVFLLLGDEANKEKTGQAIEELVKADSDGKLVVGNESTEKTPYDHLISANDLHNLVAKAQYLKLLS